MWGKSELRSWQTERQTRIINIQLGCAAEDKLIMTLQLIMCLNSLIITWNTTQVWQRLDIKLRMHTHLKKNAVPFPNF